MKSKSTTIESLDKKATDQGHNDSNSDTIQTPKSVIHMKQEATSSRHMLFAESLVNMLFPVLLALALRMVGLNGEGTWFTFFERARGAGGEPLQGTWFMLQGISISSITITVVILWVISERVPQAILFVVLASVLVRIIMVYKNYMIIVLPLLDFMMHILSQLKIRMDGGKRTEKSPVDGTDDEQQLITSMTSRHKMAREEQIESSRVDEEHLTSMASQQTMNQEDQAESSRLHGQKIDKGEITRVDEQQLTSMTSNEIQIMEQEEQIEITRVYDEQPYVLTSQQTTDQQEQIESSRVDKKHLSSTKSQQRMDQEVKLFGVRNLGLPMTMTNLYLHVVPGLLRTSHRYGTLVRAGMAVVSMLALCSQMLSPVWSHNGFPATENYIISASVVITAYGLLLQINMSYIKIIIVPITILIFIVALWNKFRSKRGLKMGSGYYVKDVSNKSIEDLLFLTALPYCALYFEAFFPNSLALSHFLWFLSSSLGAVAVMIALLPVAASPGGAQVLQLLHKTCITVLTITVHTEAAEWAREDTALVFTPELVTVLIWFTIPFRLGVSDSSIHWGILPKSIVAGPVRFILSTRLINHCRLFFSRNKAASAGLSTFVFMVLAYTTLPAYQYKGRTRALRTCSFSGCLTYFSMCMLRQWPGSKPVSRVPVKLLEFFAKNCFIAAALLAVMSAMHGDFVNYMLLVDTGRAILFINYMLVDTGRAILFINYMFLFLLLGPAENKRRFLLFCETNRRRFLRHLVPIVAAGRGFIHLSQRLYSSLNQRLKQCAQWLEKTSPDDPTRGKFKTE